MPLIHKHIYVCFILFSVLILSSLIRGFFMNKFLQFLPFCFTSFLIITHYISLFSLPQVSARDQIEYLTAQAWLSENKQLEQKVG